MTSDLIHATLGKFVPNIVVLESALHTKQQFDEIRVYEGIAERTGQTVDRQAIRKSPTACRTLAELTRSSRRLGDGLFYLPVSLWPEGVTQLSLAQKWTTMS